MGQVLGQVMGQVIAALLVIEAVFAAGFLATSGMEFVRPPAGAAVLPSEAELYAGSIVYIPDEGKLCRQILFDNRTGRLDDKGMVDCALADPGGSAAPKQWPAARVRVISTGFRRR